MSLFDRADGARVWALALLACAVTGCASSSPNYDARFGQAVRQNLQAQTFNPQAGESADLVQGLDGGAARESVQRYRDSFKAPPAVTNVINIGGAR